MEITHGAPSRLSIREMASAFASGDHSALLGDSNPILSTTTTTASTTAHTSANPSFGAASSLHMREHQSGGLSAPGAARPQRTLGECRSGSISSHGSTGGNGEQRRSLDAGHAAGVITVTPVQPFIPTDPLSRSGSTTHRSGEPANLPAFPPMLAVEDTTSVGSVQGVESPTAGGDLRPSSSMLSTRRLSALSAASSGRNSIAASQLSKRQSVLNVRSSHANRRGSSRRTAVETSGRSSGSNQAMYTKEEVDQLLMLRDERAIERDGRLRQQADRIAELEEVILKQQTELTSLKISAANDSSTVGKIARVNMAYENMLAVRTEKLERMERCCRALRCQVDTLRKAMRTAASSKGRVSCNKDSGQPGIASSLPTAGGLTNSPTASPDTKVVSKKTHDDASVGGNRRGSGNAPVVAQVEGSVGDGDGASSNSDESQLDLGIDVDLVLTDGGTFEHTTTGALLDGIDSRALLKEFVQEVHTCDASTDTFDLWSDRNRYVVVSEANDAPSSPRVSKSLKGSRRGSGERGKNQSVVDFGGAPEVQEYPAGETGGASQRVARGNRRSVETKRVAKIIAEARCILLRRACQQRLRFSNEERNAMRLDRLMAVNRGLEEQLLEVHDTARLAEKAKYTIPHEEVSYSF